MLNRYKKLKEISNLKDDLIKAQSFLIKSLIGQVEFLLVLIKQQNYQSITETKESSYDHIKHN